MQYKEVNYRQKGPSVSSLTPIFTTLKKLKVAEITIGSQPKPRYPDPLHVIYLQLTQSTGLCFNYRTKFDLVLKLSAKCFENRFY